MCRGIDAAGQERRDSGGSTFSAEDQIVQLRVLFGVRHPMRVVAVITFCLLAARPALSQGAAAELRRRRMRTTFVVVPGAEGTPTNTAWRIAAIRNMAATDSAR